MNIKNLNEYRKSKTLFFRMNIKNLKNLKVFLGYYFKNIFS